MTFFDKKFEELKKISSFFEIFYETFTLEKTEMLSF
jgi:hypothetical protein